MKADMFWRNQARCSGQVCVRGTRIMAWAVASRFAAGESIASISMDFNISAASVAESIRLVVSASFGRQGIFRQVEKRMEQLVEES